MTALLTEIAAQHNRDLHGQARERRLAATATQGTDGRQRQPRPGRLEIRRLATRGDDRSSLRRVAERDSATVPAGEVIGAELDGRLLAAHSLTTGETVADPFVETELARELLELRAGQIARAEPLERSLAWARRSAESTGLSARHGT